MPFGGPAAGPSKPDEPAGASKDLEHLMPVVRAQEWLALAVFGALVAVASSWAFFGTLPVTDERTGVFIAPVRITGAASPVAGRVLSFQVEPGGLVRAGDVVALVEPVGPASGRRHAAPDPASFLQLRGEREVVATFEGRLLQATVSPAQRVAAGQWLGLWEVDDPSPEPACLSFVPVGDGPEIEAGMLAKAWPLAPSARGASLRGRVASVSPVPLTREAAGLLVGSSDLCAQLFGASPGVAVVIRLDPEPAATSPVGGAPVTTAGTLARLRVTVSEQTPIRRVFPSLARPRRSGAPSGG